MNHRLCKWVLELHNSHPSTMMNCSSGYLWYILTREGRIKDCDLATIDSAKTLIGQDFK